MNELNIFNILAKLRDVDKLKAILMTNEQRELFDSLPKPILTLREEKKRRTLSRLGTANAYLMSKEHKNQIQAEKDVKEVLPYINLLKKKKKSDVEKRLAKMFEDLLKD